MERNPPHELRLEPGGPLRRAGRTARLVIGIALVLLFAVPPSIRFGTNWLWFSEIGLQSILLKELTTKLLLFAVVAALVLYALVLPFGLVREFGYGTVIASMFTFFATMGLELLATEIEEPFGTDRNDLPLDDIAAVIARDAAAILTPPSA